MYAPIALFVYARPQHTIKTIERLKDNILAKDSELYIFSDGARDDDETKAKVNEVRKYIRIIPEKNWFKNVKIFESNINKGLANSIIDGVTQVINKYGKIIVLEDDLETSPDFLLFMNNALEFYKNNKKIWSVTGYSLPIKIPKYYKHDIYLSYRGCSWGWGTWKDRWEKVDWQVRDYETFKNNFYKRSLFNRGGSDMAKMLDYQMEGKIDSWAIRWCYAQFKFDMLTVYPVISRVKNIGLDGSGTHSGINPRFNVSISNSLTPFNLEDVELDKTIIKRFKDYYSISLFQRVKWKIKRWLKF